MVMGHNGMRAMFMKGVNSVDVGINKQRSEYRKGKQHGDCAMRRPSPAPTFQEFRHLLSVVTKSALVK